MLSFSPEVEEALRTGKGVVALESTIITHGMPYPENLETAQLLESIVRENGAVPATIALMHGKIKIGLSLKELELLAREGKSAHKVSRRDIPFVLANGGIGSTTVAATMILARMAKISIFATGGIGGVHRGSVWDISADITELGRTPVLVVCAGAKSILDLPKTVELLETAGVNVMGYKTNEFPAFFNPHSGLATSSRVESESEVAQILKIHLSLDLQSGLLLTCPIPDEFVATGITIATNQALQEADEKGITGKDITPFLLTRIHEITNGNSLKANIELVKNNVKIASKIAKIFAYFF